jgi:DNA-binding CsgD family transcriptional regulator
MKTSGRWSTSESEQLYDLRTSGKTIKEIAAEMGRSEHSVEARWRWLHISEESRERRRQAEYARRRTLGMKVRGRSGACGRSDQTQRSYPVEVFIDRDAREKTPRTLTAVLCGDPAPGWSALDRKLQGARA